MARQDVRVSAHDAGGLQILTQMIDRLIQAEAKYAEEYEQSRKHFIQQTTQAIQTLTQVMTTSANTNSRVAAANALLTHAMPQAPTVTVTQGFSRRHYLTPDFCPYLTNEEYELLKAWRDGEDLVVVKLGLGGATTDHPN